jgi:hypothetical protein
MRVVRIKGGGLALVYWTVDDDAKFNYRHTVLLQTKTLFISIELVGPRGSEEAMTVVFARLLDSLILSGPDRPPKEIENSIAQPSTPLPTVVDGCHAVNVIGNWQANVSVDVPRVDVDVSFTFRPDGTYSYSGGQGSFVWTSHDGSYSLAPNGGDQYYRCLLNLTPNPTTIRTNPQNRYGLMPLQARSLMADRRTTFRVSDSIVPGQLLLFDASLARNGVGMFSLESVR